MRHVAHIVTWECASAHVKSNLQAKESTIIWHGKVSETKSRHTQPMQNSKARQNLELGALPSDLTSTLWKCVYMLLRGILKLTVHELQTSYFLSHRYF